MPLLGCRALQEDLVFVSQVPTASLSVEYLRGLAVIAQRDGPAGWARLERLCNWLADWYARDDDWRRLWAFTMTEESHDRVHREKERRLLRDVAVATGVANPDALAEALEIVVFGTAVAATDGDGRAEASLGALLDTVWRLVGGGSGPDTSNGL
jgi:hypothetical protein